MSMDPPALAFALVAGAVAAFNPCGFALLPPTSGCWSPASGPVRCRGRCASPAA